MNPSHFLNKHNGSDCICLIQKFNDTAQTIQLLDKDNLTSLLLTHNISGAAVVVLNKTDGLLEGLLHKPGHGNSSTGDVWPSVSFGRIVDIV